MAAEAASTFALVGAALAMSGAAIVLLLRVAPALGLVDVPGGRKSHLREVPLVGGLAIFLALAGVSAVTEASARPTWLLAALAIALAGGLLDDLREIGPGSKLAILAIASAVLLWSGVELHAVGDLVGLRPIGLWIFAAPMTIVAIVGVANAMNMMDGMDGLGGSIAFVAAAWYALIAWQSGLRPELETASILCGAIGGFLLFNLRLPWQREARAFLGDSGSLMVGLALAWLAIQLTQGPGRELPPICALWVVLLPLADCVSLMARRLRAKGNPFDADRRHIHHYLLARGFTHAQALATLVALSMLFGAVGFAGWRLDLPEPALFWPFFFGFFAYHAWIRRAWKKLEAERGAAIPALLLDEDEARALG